MTAAATIETDATDRDGLTEFLDQEFKLEGELAGDGAKFERAACGADWCLGCPVCTPEFYEDEI